MHPADAFARRLGLAIRDRDLLAQALTHSSWLHEHPGETAGHNERLEFLGDAAVNLAISEALYRRHPEDDVVGGVLAFGISGSIGIVGLGPGGAAIRSTCW